MSEEHKTPDRQASERLGLPDDLRLYTPFPFEGMDAKSSPVAIKDDAFARILNMVRIGSGQLAFVPGNGPVFYTAATTHGSATIVNYEFFLRVDTNQQYVAVFLSDGSADQVQVSNGAVTAICSAGTLAVTPTVPTTAMWASKWLLIGTSAGYYIWDGQNMVFCKPGSLGPQAVVVNGGGPYTSAPTVTVAGGHGSGATVVATLDTTPGSGAVNMLTVTNPGTGYQVGDVVKLIFTGGGLTNKIAQANNIQISDGVTTGAGLASIVISDGGTGYSNEPTVTIGAPTAPNTGGGGIQASAVASGQANSITELSVVVPGLGYVTPPTVTVSAPAGGGDTCTAQAVIQFSGIVGDGTNLGIIVPTDPGAGYRSTPNVVAVDSSGSGTGFVGVAVMNGDTVDHIKIINPGQGYKTGTYITFIGGNPAVAEGAVSLMPQGGQNPVSGQTVAVFANQVWMANGKYLYTSAPGLVTNFSASAGGSIEQDADNFLVQSITALRASGAFLYKFGDSSINSISQPTISTTTGSSVLRFSDINVDPQTGTPWPQTIQPFGTSLVFANPQGVFAVYGSTVAKVSDELDDFFANLPTQPVLPSAGTIVLFGIKFYALFLQVVDPILGNGAYVFLWDGRRWYMSSQQAAIRQIASYQLNSVFAMYGNTGGLLTQLYTTPANTLPKTIVTKWYGMEAGHIYKQGLRFYVSFEEALSFNLTFHTEQKDLPISGIAYPGVAGPVGTTGYGTMTTVQAFDPGGLAGLLIGWTISTTQPSGTLVYCALGYKWLSGLYS